MWAATEFLTYERAFRRTSHIVAAVGGFALGRLTYLPSALNISLLVAALILGVPVVLLLTSERGELASLVARVLIERLPRDQREIVEAWATSDDSQKLTQYLYRIHPHWSVPGVADAVRQLLSEKANVPE